MNRNTPLLFVAALLILLSFSCKKDSVLSTADTSYRYYPLKVGQYVIYDVDSINFFDVTMTSDTVHYQIKESLDTVFADNTGKNAYLITRMKRANDTSAWQPLTNYYTNLTPKTAERVEENQRFIKLIFPVKEGATWNGNIYIYTKDTLSFLSDTVYQYSNVNSRNQFNGLTYDSTATVTSQNNENLIQKDLEQEVYATGRGLVYKISEHVSKQDYSKSWDTPEKGYIVKMSLHEFNP